MPLNGNTYVAPTWRNGQPPTLDPAELQAISDSIVRNQSKNTDQDNLIAALQTAVGGKAQIEIGSYVGTGEIREIGTVSITCSFVPTAIFLMSINGFTGQVYSNNSVCRVIFLDALTESYENANSISRPCFFMSNNRLSSIGSIKVKRSSDSKTVTWYPVWAANDTYKSEVAGAACNTLNSIYTWIAVA